MFAAPKRTTTAISVGPAARRSGRRARISAAPSAPTAGAARRTPSPTGPTWRMSLRVDRQQRDPAADEHGEEVERDRAEQHPRAPDEPEAADEPGEPDRRRRARATDAQRGHRDPGDRRRARRRPRRRLPASTRRAGRRPPARRSPRSGRRPSGGRPRPGSRSGGTTSGVSAWYAGQPIALATPVSAASRKYGQTTPASATVTASSATATPTINASDKRGDQPPRQPVGQVTGRQREHEQRNELREPDQAEVERVLVDREHLPADGDRDHVLGEAHREDRRPEEPEVALLERRREPPPHRSNLAAVAVRLCAVADETTAGKLERMQALREEARHQGSEKAVARQPGAGQAARARARGEAARPGLVRRARPLRPPPRGRVRDARAAAAGATPSSPATARSSAARSSSSRRTSRSSAGRCRRSSPRRSAR